MGVPKKPGQRLERRQKQGGDLCGASGKVKLLSGRAMLSYELQSHRQQGHQCPTNPLSESQQLGKCAGHLESLLHRQLAFPAVCLSPKGAARTEAMGSSSPLAYSSPPAGKELLSIRHFQAFFLSFSPGQLHAECPHPHTTHRDTGIYFLAQKCCGTFRDEPRSPAQCKRAGPSRPRALSLPSRETSLGASTSPSEAL